MPLGCAICVGTWGGHVATADRADVDCSKLDNWDLHNASYKNGAIVYYQPSSTGKQYKCSQSACTSTPGSDSQWTEVGACNKGTAALSAT
jgi:hypothetical protein